MMRLPLLLTAFLIFTACDKQKAILLINESDLDLENQPIVVLRSYFDLSADDFVQLTNSKGKVITAQHDDIDGDGQWDEIGLALDFTSKEEIAIKYETVEEAGLQVFPIKTAAYLGVSEKRDGNFQSVSQNTRPDDHVAQSTPFLYQYEGPGWESDLVAFRGYFDSRNGKDIFGKTTSDLKIHKIGLSGNYHELQDWGMDILKVGNSLGAGAIAILKNDSLYRLTKTSNATFRKIAQGPVRSVIELDYQGWDVVGEKYNLKETISIWAGKRHYESVISFSGSEKDTLVTGLVNLKNLTSNKLNVRGSNILYTHGRQSENKDMLGMAVVVPEENIVMFSEAPKKGSGITNTYTAMLKPVDGIYQFSFYVGWEAENRSFQDEAFFIEALEKLTTSQQNTITIKISN
ncbi:MAG: hypothetical protein ACJA0X_002104 [Cyclobacteriaceae bacterium]|jgi:hypothetical protein